LWCRSYKNFDDITTQNPATETLYNADGTLQTFKVSALSRTYAQVIAGVPGSITMSYNSTTFAFSLSYKINQALTTQTTVVYLNQQLHYPNGYVYTITPPGVANVTQTEPNYLSIQHCNGATGQLTFTLQAK
jgi:endoglycosylceramidase